MPQAVAELEDARIDISPELVHQFDADFMISTYWPANGTTVQSIYELWECGGAPLAAGAACRPQQPVLHGPP